MELQLPGGWKSKTKSFNIISNVDLSKFWTAAFRKPPRPRNVGNDPERWRIGFKARTLTFVCEGRIEVFLYSSVQQQLDTNNDRRNITISQFFPGTNKHGFRHFFFSPLVNERSLFRLWSNPSRETLSTRHKDEKCKLTSWRVTPRFVSPRRWPRIVLI